MEKTHTHIKSLIFKKKKGELLFTSDFRGLGSDSAIKQALSRMVKSGEINRLAHGIYYVPKTDPQLGEMRPSADEVVRMIAVKEKIRVKPAGAFALHQLGLTTQVPTKRVYITDGHQRQFMIGKLQIKFKPTTPKRLMRKGKISSLVIQALEELGTSNIDPIIHNKMKELLKKEDPKLINHDLKLAPIKINNYIVNIMKDITI
jgi:hypothetical protein